MNLGSILPRSGQPWSSPGCTLKSLSSNPTIQLLHEPRQNLQKSRDSWSSTGRHSQIPRAPTLTIQSNMNLGNIYKNLGTLDQALAATQVHRTPTPITPTPTWTWAISTKNLGNLEQALSSTLKSLELQPETQCLRTWAISTKIWAISTSTYRHSQVHRNSTR